MTVTQLAYLQEQFALLVPNKNGYVSLQNLKAVSYFLFVTFLHSLMELSDVSLHLQQLLKFSTEAMKDSRVLDFANMVCIITKLLLLQASIPANKYYTFAFSLYNKYR